MNLESLNNKMSIPDIIDTILSTVTNAVNWSGAAILNILQSIFPDVHLPEYLVEPLGYLVVLSILVLFIQTLRRIVWMLVVAGWLLMLIRIFSIVFNGE